MASTQSAAQETAFSFTGKTGEYFGIWIVNVLLIIVTLGIYTAWAKVRTNRYFYGHTLLDDAPFDYLASPVAILIGWLIGVAIFIVYALLGAFLPLLQIVFALLFFLFIPLLVVKAMAFRLRNTAHRNIRFAFNKNYGDAALVFIGLPLLTPLTLGLLFPYVIYRQKKFIVENSRYGQSPFAFEGTAGGFYIISLVAIGIFVVTIILASLVGGGITAAFANNEAPPELAILQGLVMIPVFLVYFVIFAYWQTAITNLIWNHVRIDQHRFHSTLNFGYMLWLYFSNTLAIIFSLGLLIPWARVRTVRYRLSRLGFIPAGDINTFLAARQKEESAIGEEIGEVMDIDIGL